MGGGEFPEEAGISAVYSALQVEDSLRLLELDPASDAQAPLQAAPFEALSYSWQSDDPNASPMPISCNSHELEIGSNLWYALRRLRLADRARWLWADALCINQANISERNQQVRQMSLIYRRASAVVVWLGEEPGADIDVAAGFDALSDVVERWRRDPGSKIFEETLSAPSLPRVGFKKPDSVRTLTPKEVEAVLHIYNRTWFKRLWVIQEVTLASMASVQLGALSVPWDTVGLAAELLLWNSEAAFADADIDEGFRALEPACNIHRARLCSSEARAAHLLDFHSLLVMTRGATCQDRRDRIFGLLAIPTRDGDKRKPKPDYALEAGEVFRHVAVDILEGSGTLDMLSDCQHEPGAGLGLLGRYPSWVPQWDVHPHVRLMFGGLDDRYKTYDAAGGRARELAWSAYGSPRVRGVQVARVVETSRMLAGECFEGGEKYGEEVFSGASSKDGIALPGSKYPVVLPEGRDLVRVMAQTTSGLYDLTPAKVGEYAVAIRNGWVSWSFPHVFDRPKEELAPEARRLREAVDGWAAQAGDRAGFVPWMKVVCRDRRLFVLDTGEVGLGPAVMKPGDVVCVLYGTRVPFVLRAVGPAYAVVGECYADGLMKGRAVDEMEVGGGQERWFELA